jgi:hypothetical protein
MSRKGRSRLRTMLFFAVMRLVQVDDAFAREYLRFQQRDNNPLWAHGRRCLLPSGSVLPVLGDQGTDAACSALLRPGHSIDC